MFVRIVTIALLMCLMIAPTAQADTHPTIAILSFVTSPNSDTEYIQTALFAVLQANGVISSDEWVTLSEDMSVENDAITIISGDAGFDFPTANALVESMLDEGATALVTLSTPMTLAALNVTQDMDDPPAIFFAQAVNPFEAGIAEGACDKPANITGIEAKIDYDEILPIMQMQVPDLASIGTLHNSSEVSGRLGAVDIAAAAEAAGIAVEAVAVSNISELPSATEGLISKGVDALVVPWDVTTSSGLPIIASISQDNDVPLFYANSLGAVMGATIGVGQSLHLEQGTNLGHILAAYLNGELDIADVAISALSGSGISVNLGLPNIPIAPEVAEMAELSVLESGRVTSNPQLYLQRLSTNFGVTPMQVMQLLASLGTGDLRTDLIGPGLALAAESESGQAIALDFLASLSCENM